MIEFASLRYAIENRKRREKLNNFSRILFAKQNFSIPNGLRVIRIVTYYSVIFVLSSTVSKYSE